METVEPTRPATNELLIRAPATGRFRPLPPRTVTCEGEVLNEGEVFGFIETSDTEVPIRSGSHCFLVSMVVAAGDRVELGDAVARLWSG